MWEDKNKDAPIVEFLGWLLFLSLLVQGILLLLEPYSISYLKSGHLTVGYIIYAILGMFFPTPAPLIALLITLHRTEGITVKEYFKRIVHTPKPLMAITVTGLFCVIAFVFAVCCGIPNGSPWYMMPLGFMVMLPFVGIAEEPGWRGFLQPELEKKFPFPVATSITAIIWCVWHFPDWLLPTGNHYGDSLIGFSITIFVGSFAAAAIYKATKSTLACAVYHSFINSIGATYDWNALFDAYPKTNGMLLYFSIVFALAILIWITADTNPLCAKSLRRNREKSVFSTNSVPCPPEFPKGSE